MLNFRGMLHHSGFPRPSPVYLWRIDQSINLSINDEVHRPIYLSIHLSIHQIKLPHPSIHPTNHHCHCARWIIPFTHQSSMRLVSARVSYISCGSIPAMGDPTILRRLSRPLIALVKPIVGRCLKISEASSSGIPRSWMLALVVISTTPIYRNTCSS